MTVHEPRREKSSTVGRNISVSMSTCYIVHFPRQSGLTLPSRSAPPLVPSRTVHVSWNEAWTARAMAVT
ncbi:hypothetical protein G7K_3671-t1 [Saitoella complicata NRRL Y-17804]|uniref:Uncharacterized protein n=1 Tax=Saitoella complicata (strain BCRC 22490 / CBS 7301 / JCM 7358 / NBRC 10748 / NRRL Y-17804) TaxID=698492 RepID=A0A0E9NI30_SAICN|nr:hypothetical protein G7K_3671-t1 [Saitoella complicata NRRL Y-17804]